MLEIPQGLINSMFIASLSYTIAVWLVVTIFNRNFKTALSVGVGLGIWYGLVFFLGKSGFFGLVALIIPFIAVAFVTLAIVVKFLYSNKALQTLVSNIPVHWLIAVQIFRVQGYGFIRFYELGLIPGEFALPTGWGDVLIGVLAPIVAILYLKKRMVGLAKVWNYLGIADLTLALTLGISTYPDPTQLLPTMVDNGLISQFPLVMVPLFAVPISILLHLFTLRKLKAN